MCSSSSQMGKSQAIVAGDMRRSKTEDRRRASARKEEAQASKEWGAFKEGRVRFGSSWEERESPPSVPGWRAGARQEGQSRVLSWGLEEVETWRVEGRG